MKYEAKKCIQNLVSYLIKARKQKSKTKQNKKSKRKTKQK